jgi:chitinase
MIQGDSNEQEETTLHHIERCQACPDSNMCLSQWSYCGTGDVYCSNGCQAGPCLDGNGGNGADGSIFTEENFPCAFNTIDAGTGFNRLTGFRNSGWKQLNTDEATVFLSHIFHETDCLQTIREYCAPG